MKLKTLQKLKQLLQSNNGEIALEALWAINVSGGFNEEIANIALDHTDPFVREWAIRLLGDPKKISPVLSTKMAALAAKELNPEVRSQLAATAKRLPGSDAIPIIKNLLKSHDDINDPDIPLLTWWAIEAKTESDRDAVLSIFNDRGIWQNKVVQDFLLKRVMQRYIMAGGDANYSTASKLIKLAPSDKMAKILISGLTEGLRGRDVIGLSAELTKAIQPYQSELFGGALGLAIRQGDPKAINKALDIIADENANPDNRLSYINIMGQTDLSKSVPVLLKVVESSKSSGALKQTALHALQRYDVDEIGARVVKAFPQFRGDEGVRNAAIDLFASRAKWTLELLNAIEQTKRISKTDVSDQVARRLKLLNNPEIAKSVDKHWPNVKLATSSEKNEAIAKYMKLINSGNGDIQKGRALFMSHCGVCHKMLKDGGVIGPDLTGYERSNVNYLLLNIVDPNADIREGYVVHRVTTLDGRTLEGKIVARNGDALTLQSLAGKETILSGAQIKEMKALPTSIMPERILDPLSDQEVRDLFAYIMKAK